MGSREKTEKENAMEFIMDNIFTCAIQDARDFGAIEGKALEKFGYNFAVLHPCKILGQKKYIIHAFVSFGVARDDAREIIFKQFAEAHFWGNHDGQWEKVEIND